VVEVAGLDRVQRLQRQIAEGEQFGPVQLAHLLVVGVI
jgi:hypothetical protein